MKHIHFINILIIAIVFSSCEKEKRYLDGKYKSEIPLIGTVYHTIDGNEIIIDNPITGVSKLKCKQYEDRIEYIEGRSGLKRVLFRQETGNLKLSDLMVLEKIEDINDEKDRESSEFDTMSKRNKIPSSKEFTENQVYNSINDKKVSKDSFDNVPAKIKNIDRKDGKIYLTVDIMQMKFKENNDIEIINNNSKLRSYIVDENIQILSSHCEDVNFANYVWDNKERVLSLVKKLGFVMISTNERGKVIRLNLGCWS